jgi:molybdopterin-synthase adenylyltransferase
VIDGTDNLETRYLVNDACVSLGVPWVYGGAVGSQGLSMTILPDDGPCFRCAFPQAPTPGSLATCETAGVLGSIIAVVAAAQFTEAVKLIVGARDKLNRGLLVFDVWSNEYEHLPEIVRNPDCPCCGRRDFSFLDARSTSQTTSLCGRNAVQVSPAEPRALDLAALRRQFAAIGTVGGNDYLVRLGVDGFELTIFPDGRAIVKGTSDDTVARSVYAKYVGH